MTNPETICKSIKAETMAAARRRFSKVRPGYRVTKVTPVGKVPGCWWVFGVPITDLGASIGKTTDGR